MFKSSLNDYTDEESQSVVMIAKNPGSKYHVRIQYNFARWSFRRRVVERSSSLEEKLGHMAGSRGGQRVRSPPPLKNHKNIGFLSNTGTDPLKNHKATKPAFNVGQSSARQQNAN